MPEERNEIFRPARHDEVDTVADVVAHSFPSPARGPRWWRDYLIHGPHGGPEAIWVAEDAGEVVGCCLLLPLRQWISGVALPMTGLGVVTTAPTHRRRGLAGRMVTAGLLRARERGDVVSALYPFRIDYYGGLGYGLAGEAHQYMLPPTSLPDSPEDRRRMRMVRTPADRKLLQEVYSRGIRLQTGQVERSGHAWRYVLEGDDRAAFVYVGDAGDPEGYVIVRYRADLPIAERYLDVEERMWLTSRARRGIYAWLASMGDQWPRVAYRAHPHERFGEVVREPRLPVGEGQAWHLWFPSATLMRGPMFRVLNVASALRARNYALTEETTFDLDVDDPQIPDNRGTWRVTLRRGRAAVERADGGASDATLRIPVRALSRVFIGALRVSDAVADGTATTDQPRIARLLDAAFEVPKPWTFERF